MDKARARLLFFLPKDTIHAELAPALTGHRYQVFVKSVDSSVLDCIVATKPELIFLYHDTQSCTRWEQLATDVRQTDPSLPVILLTNNGSEELAVKALRLGVKDYLALPVSDKALEQA